MQVARGRWAHPEVYYRLSIASESDEVQRAYHGLHVCRGIMPVRYKRPEPGLVGDLQVGRYASGTSAYLYQRTHSPDDHSLGLVCPLFLC